MEGLEGRRKRRVMHRKPLVERHSSAVVLVVVADIRELEADILDLAAGSLGFVVGILMAVRRIGLEGALRSLVADRTVHLEEVRSRCFVEGSLPEEEDSLGYTAWVAVANVD